MPLGGLLPYDGSPYSITIKSGGPSGGGQRQKPQGPMGPNASSLQPMGGGEPRVGIPRMPSQPIMISEPPLPPGGPGMPPPGIGLPGPPMRGPMPIMGPPTGGATPPVQAPPFQLPEQIDWQAILPLLLAMRGGGGMGAVPRAAFDRAQ